MVLNLGLRSHHRDLNLEFRRGQLRTHHRGPRRRLTGTTTTATPHSFPEVAMSVSQMVADNNRLLSVPASASNASMVARISRV